MPVQYAPKPRLHVHCAGKRHYIEVPSGSGVELLAYLRSKGVPAAPPTPCFVGVDTIDLRGPVDDDAVQRLLDHWN
jgi:hypothetical protein